MVRMVLEYSHKTKNGSREINKSKEGRENRKDSDR
jgi:hypothetical protein